MVVPPVLFGIMSMETRVARLLVCDLLAIVFRH